MLCRIRHIIERQKEALKQSRTTCLCLQYMDMMDILRRFIKAERTWNWNLHLHTVYEMLLYFLAAGHTLYGKSAYMYLNKTRGRGLTETQRLVWLLSMPACAGVNAALQDLTAITYNTSDQHKEATRARQERDSKDT